MSVVGGRPDLALSPPADRADGSWRGGCKVAQSGHTVFLPEPLQRLLSTKLSDAGAVHVKRPPTGHVRGADLFLDKALGERNADVYHVRLVFSRWRQRDGQ